MNYHNTKLWKRVIVQILIQKTHIIENLEEVIHGSNILSTAVDEVMSKESKTYI